MKGAIAQALGQVTFSRTDVVGPEVSGELKVKGVEALLAAIGLMLLYIWFRFELQFGLGAVVALFHDLILSFGLILLLRLEFSLNLIAALLTIIGYSMNDTVVVFDRLRENLRKYKRMPLREVIDLSVNERCRGPSSPASPRCWRSPAWPSSAANPCGRCLSCCCSASSSAPIRRSMSPRRSSCCGASSGRRTGHADRAPAGAALERRHAPAAVHRRLRRRRVSASSGSGGPARC